MSIVALNKVTLCGLHRNHELVLDGLQQLGCMHLIPLQPTASGMHKPAPTHATDALRALHYLHQVTPQRRQIQSAPEFDVNRIVQQVLRNQKHRRKVGDELEYLNHQVRQLAPWGDFSLPKQASLGGYKLWLYHIPRDKMKQLKELPYPWQEVGRDHRFCQVVVVAQKKPPPTALPVLPLSLRFHSLKALKREVENLEIKLEALDWERHSLSRWTYLVSSNLAQEENRLSLEHAHAQLIERDGIFVLRGWVPQDDIAQLEAFARRKGLGMTITTPGKKDNPPTLLSNPIAFQAGADLVRFYETPRYDGWDPSILVFFSFALFFAMILADAGYAFLLTLVMLFYWKSLGKTPQKRRFRTLGAIMLAASWVYGILVGGYFGLTPPTDHPLALLKVLELNNYDSMIRLSIIVGCLHVGLANGAVAYHAKGFPANAPPLGWVAITVGGLMVWLGEANWDHFLPVLGGILISLGFILVFGFASQRKVDSVKSALLRGLDGFIAVTGITKLFGDIFSYLRLFALGLASGSLALTFNQIAEQLQEAIPGLGLFLSILILILGHSVNLGLGLVSGFVHGLRLNFIEFFNWAVPEEGYPFQPFSKKEIKL